MVPVPGVAFGTIRASGPRVARHRPMTRATVAPAPPALECVECEEPTAPECFVCGEEGGVLLTNICKCVDRHIHVECQRRMMALPRHRGVCAVCAAPYKNVVIQQRRRISSWGWLSIMGCIMSIVTLAMAAIEITLYHLDRTDNFTSPYLFISGALTLLFLLSLAMMHLLARQGSLIIMRSVIKIRPEPIADAA